MAAQCLCGCQPDLLILKAKNIIVTLATHAFLPGKISRLFLFKGRFVFDLGQEARTRQEDGRTDGRTNERTKHVMRFIGTAA